MQEQVRQVLSWLFENRGKVVGSLLGLLFGWLTLRYGFLKAIFVVLCLSGGYVVGSSFDNRESFQALLDRVFPRYR